MKGQLSAIGLLLGFPALACDNAGAASWLLTGGPLAPLLVFSLALRPVRSLPDPSLRFLAAATTVPASPGGYWLVGEWVLKSETFLSSGLGLLAGPLLLLVGNRSGRLPSLLLSLAPRRQVKLGPFI